MPDTIKVVIVDDSAMARQAAREILERESDIEVIGTAPDMLYAQDKMRVQWPDVLVIDIDLPRMDPLAFLRKLMRERPTPTIVVSSLAEKGAAATIEALAAGALAIIAKPTSGVTRNELGDDLVAAVRAAAHAKLRPTNAVAAPPSRPKLGADAMLAAPIRRSQANTAERVIAIGTSTGGTQALETVLRGLPPSSHGIVIVQHMPEKFTAMFAERLDNLCALEVREAKNGDRVVAGRALIAPGGRHMMLRRSGAQYYVEVADGPLVNRHKPSVDVLFRSVAQTAGSNALGVIMTGMGDDGARGMKEMHDAGAATIAEDEASCVVFGMPREAIRLGGVDRVVPLDAIAPEIVAYR